MLVLILAYLLGIYLWFDVTYISDYMGRVGKGHYCAQASTVGPGAENWVPNIGTGGPKSSPLSLSLGERPIVFLSLSLKIS